MDFLVALPFLISLRRLPMIPPQPVGGYYIYSEATCERRFWPDWTAFPAGWTIEPPSRCVATHTLTLR